MARRIGWDQAMANRLWASGYHEARLLATMIADPARSTEALLERWVRGFDSWDICDQCCSNLFVRTPWAHLKAVEWVGRKAEYVRRAGFVMMAEIAVHDKAAPDAAFTPFLELIQQETDDERKFVRKAANWALRQIGKRNRRLNRQAVRSAKALQRAGTPSARWIAADALGELTSQKVLARFN